MSTASWVAKNRTSPTSHALAMNTARTAALNTGGGFKGAKESAEHLTRAAFHAEKARDAGHAFTGDKDVKRAHTDAAKAYSYAAGKADAQDKPKAERKQDAEELRDKAKAHREAAASGAWDESKHPRDENGKFT